MAAYTKLVNFASKDNLIVGNPLKVVTGTELDAEFNAIATSSVQNYASVAAAAATGSAAAIAALSGTSTTSLLIEVASKTFTTQADDAYTAGVWVTATSAANVANWMYGQVTSYSGTTLIVDVQVVGGSGTLADWNLSISSVRGATGVQGAPGTGVNAEAVGFTITAGTTPKTLTVALDANVAGTNTGDQTPTSLGLLIGTNVQAYDADLTTWAGITPGANVGTFLSTPTIANLNSAVSDADLAILGANTFTGAQNVARATIASHATTGDIWGAAGNQIDWTGTATTTAFPNAPQAGAERVLICAGACSFTAGANMLIDGVTSGNTVTCAANDQVIVRAVSTTQFKLSRVKYDGTAQVAAASGFTLATPVASTSGTAINFTGIPAGVKQIVMTLKGVSLSGVDSLLIRIGDAGGLETSGYVSSGFDFAVSAGSSTAGYAISPPTTAARTYYGSFIFSLENSTTFSWLMQGFTGDSSYNSWVHGGIKSLSAELTQIGLLTNGANTFDAGEVNISYI